MKLFYAAIVTSVLFGAVPSYGQLTAQLCKANETIVFAVQLKNNKWVSVCKEKNEHYIVYRFGTAAKPELQYPAVLDSSSWKQFTFNGYSRGGGKQNAAMNIAFLHFTINEVVYEVYDSWNSEDDITRCGITVAVNGKTVDMQGILKTRKGYLLALRNIDKIQQEEN